MPLTPRPLARGVKRADFLDANGEACSIQESIAMEIHGPGSSKGPYLWLGMNRGTHVLGADCTARMHLTRERAAELLPLLLAFVETGRLP